MSKRILIVDDSPVVLALHKYALETAGYQCATAPNGYSALERLFEESFALVVADETCRAWTATNWPKTFERPKAMSTSPSFSSPSGRDHKTE